MKCETTNTVLTWVLGALVLLGALFALQTIFRMREFRTLQFQAGQANAYRMAVESLANDTLAYSQKNPNADILRIMQPAQTKPATR